jgi:ABC-type branched-subunit amino acid transport system substrate-binding protein
MSNSTTHLSSPEGAIASLQRWLSVREAAESAIMQKTLPNWLSPEAPRVILMIATKKLWAAVGLASVFLISSVGAPACLGDDAPISPPSDSGSRTGINPHDEKIGVTDNEILIGAGLPLTGILSERGHQAKQGFETYIRYVNDQGGMNGRHIKIVLEDDCYDPKKVAEIFDKSFVGKVFALGCAVGSAPVAKYVQRAQATSTPMLGVLTGNPVASYFHPTQFSFRPSYNDEIKKLAEELYQHGVRKFGVLYQSDAYGYAIHDALSSAIKVHGLTIAIEAPYEKSKIGTAEAAWEHVNESRPDAVFLASTADALKSIIKLRNQATFKPIFVLSSIAVDYLHDTGKLADGTVVAEVLPPLSDSSAAVSLYRQLSKKYPSDTAISRTGLDAFLNAMILVEGVKRTGKNLTRSGFIHSIEHMKNYDLGLEPVYKLCYTENDHNGLSPTTIRLSIMKNGEPASIKNTDWTDILQSIRK